MILAFAAEKEDELSLMLKRKQSEEILKRWLERQVELEATDSLHEPDSFGPRINQLSPSIGRCPGGASSAGTRGRVRSTD